MCLRRTFCGDVTLEAKVLHVQGSEPIGTVASTDQFYEIDINEETQWTVMFSKTAYKFAFAWKQKVRVNHARAQIRTNSLWLKGAANLRLTSDAAVQHTAEAVMLTHFAACGLPAAVWYPCEGQEGI